MTFEILNQTMLILLAVTGTLVLCATFRLPSVLGYLGVGFLVGPDVLNILSAHEEIEFLSEIGIILMMFMAGLEFSQPALWKNIRIMAGMGAAVISALTLTVMTSMMMIWHYPFNAAFLIGGAVAMSSTALVNKQLLDQREFYSSHGKNAFSLALFQDLATLVFLVTIPSLAAPEGEHALRELGYAMGTMVAVFVGIYFVGHKVERTVIRFVGKLKSSEVFVLTTLLIILGAAWISNFFSLPTTIGAFLAGMIIGETEFKYKIEEDIRPFRDLLMGFFFMSMGAMIELSIISQHGMLILGLLAGILLIKFFVTVIIAHAFTPSSGTNLRTSLILAHCGEFSLLLMVLGMREGIIEPQTGKILLVTFVLSLVISTFLILYNRPITFFLLRWLKIDGRKTKVVEDAPHHASLSGHVILCGFGETGENLCKALSHIDLPIAVVETDSQKVDNAVQFGCNAIYGDAVNLRTLQSINIDKAKALVVTFDNYRQSLKIVHSVRVAYPHLPIVVRVHHMNHIPHLMDAGATTVLPDGIGTGISLSRALIKTLKIPRNGQPPGDEGTLF